MTECRTVSVSIHRLPDDVYDYLSDAARFPQWSAFITKIEPTGTSWRATTPRGTLRMQFVPRNAFRVLDHTVVTADGKQVHVPMRVLPNENNASEVTLSIFKHAGMTDEEFAADAEMVQTDLASLKRVLES